MTTINYPAGTARPSSTTTTLPARRPRRVIPEGENSPYAVSAPVKDSPLRALKKVAEERGWNADFLKYPCDCRDWQNKAMNALVVWVDGGEHRVFCVCEVEALSGEEMAEAVSMNSKEGR